MGCETCRRCGAPVVRRQWCADCLPAKADVGSAEWQRRYRELVAEDALEAGTGRHLAACRAALEAIAPGPELAALADLAEWHAQRLDEQPTNGVASEYRLTWALLLDAANDSEDDADDSELMRLVSTPVAYDPEREGWTT